MRRSAQLAVHNRYARWPIASPKAKYSNNASNVTSPTASATIAVDPHNTIPTTNGINTPAVATRFQVIEMDSPEKSASVCKTRLPRRAVLPHLITSREINHAPGRTGIPVCPSHEVTQLHAQE